MNKLTQLKNLFISQLDLNIERFGAKADYQSIQCFTDSIRIIRMGRVGFYGWLETDIGQISLGVSCDIKAPYRIREKLSLMVIDEIIKHYVSIPSEYNSEPLYNHMFTSHCL